tara:strand:+ start:339 stop:548 length:210 start_codon:yes stop_codon:yes gene_type:complete
VLKRNLLRFIAILFVAILVYFAKTNFSEYNKEKSISACVMAQKMTSESFDLEKSRKYCEGQVTKQKEAY